MENILSLQFNMSFPKQVMPKILRCFKFNFNMILFATEN